MAEAEERYWQADAAAREAASPGGHARGTDPGGGPPRGAGRPAGGARAVDRRPPRLSWPRSSSRWWPAAERGRRRADRSALAAAASPRRAGRRHRARSRRARRGADGGRGGALPRSAGRQRSSIAPRARHGETRRGPRRGADQLVAELEATRARTWRRPKPACAPRRRTADAARGRADASARRRTKLALGAIVQAQPLADAARRRGIGAGREGGRHARRAGCPAGPRRGRRPAGIGPVGRRLERACLTGLQAPDEAWPAIEAVVGGELEQALLWRDEELIGRLAEARGSARLVADRGGAEQGPSAADREAALRAVGGSRTLGRVAERRRRARALRMDRGCAGRRRTARGLARPAGRLAGGDAQRRPGRWPRPAWSCAGARIGGLRGGAPARPPARAGPGAGELEARAVAGCGDAAARAMAGRHRGRAVRSTRGAPSARPPNEAERAAAEELAAMRSASPTRGRRASAEMARRAGRARRRELADRPTPLAPPKRRRSGRRARDARRATPRAPGRRCRRARRCP